MAGTLAPVSSQNPRPMPRVALVVKGSSCASWNVLDMPKEADLVEDAVRNTLAAGARTADIAQAGAPPVPTSAMGDAILRELEKGV